jgi:Histidine phosphatase superfamily (branch 1)
MIIFTVLSSILFYIHLIWWVFISELPKGVFFYFMWRFFFFVFPRSLGHALTVTCLVRPLATFRKLSLFATSIHYLLFCQDKNFTLPEERHIPHFSSISATENDPALSKRTILFLCSEASTGNHVFDKGNGRSSFTFLFYFIPNFMYALSMEFYFFLTAQANESWFIDSPLSTKGVQQAQTLQSILRDTTLEYLTPSERALWTMLRDPNTLCVSSNLRRAVSTAALVLPAKNRIAIHAALQEISCNPDALCISPAGRILPSFTDPPALRSLYTAENGRLDATAVPHHRLYFVAEEE